MYFTAYYIVILKVLKNDLIMILKFEKCVSKYYINALAAIFVWTEINAETFNMFQLFYFFKDT